jgi:hypothetical protein
MKPSFHFVLHIQLFLHSSYKGLVIQEFHFSFYITGQLTSSAAILPFRSDARHQEALSSTSSLPPPFLTLVSVFFAAERGGIAKTSLIHTPEVLGSNFSREQFFVIFLSPSRKALG